MGEASFSNEQTGRVKGIERWEIRDRAQGARAAMVVTARECMARVARESLSADAFSRGRFAEHPPCREMRRVVTEYAHILAVLGHESRSATDLALQAVREAGGGDEAPPALLEAVRAWCLEAF